MARLVSPRAISERMSRSRSVSRGALRVRVSILAATAAVLLSKALRPDRTSIPAPGM
jgi:hypothetical protein